MDGLVNIKAYLFNRKKERGKERTKAKKMSKGQILEMFIFVREQYTML